MASCGLRENRDYAFRPLPDGLLKLVMLLLDDREGAIYDGAGVHLRDHDLYESERCYMLRKHKRRTRV